MASPASWIGSLLQGTAGRLKYPYLLMLTGSLFVLDLLIPDMLPLADEILLGLATLVLAGWRERKQDPGERR